MIRKLLFIFIFFVLIFTIIYGSDNMNKNIVKISEDFYAVKNFGGNVAFLIAEDGVVVVDAGTSLSAGKKIVNIIKEKTDKPIKYVIVTHYHNDHILGLDAFPEDIKVISSEKTKENIENISVKQKRENTEKRYPEYIESIKTKLANMENTESKEYEEMEKQLKETEEFFKEYKNTDIVIPNETFKNKKVIKLRNETFEIIQYPNTHTSGISIVYFKKRKVLHTSDLIFNNMYPYIDSERGGNTENWIKALDEISKMDINTVIPGHGDIENNKNSLNRQREYFKTMRRNIQEYINNNAELEEIKENLKIPEYSNYGKERFYKLGIETIYEELKNR
ncbi:MAG: MBL fold metallo-hydrolase [Candidatus Mcinerneyibacterium aminivorans]|uniref:MBL fold metallo-hydrolase n=1 Tax=Candidatus Mcinerneyibacterium aminivorans TaxID=2703815 RepID=A0A5D0MFD7_9BACT|nr:MAG: MBL fold metallo-hydrolase [Candidatus Mcinerneyibacterium aminivorans]